MHDGREVALKVQRPGVRDVLGLDWAVATLVSRGYQSLVGSPNDYGAVAPWRQRPFHAVLRSWICRLGRVEVHLEPSSLVCDLYISIFSMYTYTIYV